MDNSKYSDTFVCANVTYLEELTKELGAETALKVFKQMTKLFSQDFADSILIKILTDGVSQAIVSFSYAKGEISNSTNMVEFIQALRQATGWSLREAKYFCDEVDSGKSKSINLTTVQQAHTLRQALRDIGLWMT